MARPKKVTLKEKDFESAADVHELLARELDFPDYYGRNLDALEDCLGDIYEPTRIVIKRDAQGEKPWFDGFVDVIRACAERSCYLGCSIRRSAEHDELR